MGLLAIAEGRDEDWRPTSPVILVSGRFILDIDPPSHSAAERNIKRSYYCFPAFMFCLQSRDEIPISVQLYHP